jgi:hypothetical protein
MGAIGAADDAVVGVVGVVGRPPMLRPLLSLLFPGARLADLH